MAERDVEPAFPPELEELIFGIAALSRPVTIPKLMLVAHRVHDWVEPLLYRVICVSDKPPIEGFPRWTMDIPENALKRKPASFFKGAVRSVFVGFTGDSVLSRRMHQHHLLAHGRPVSVALPHVGAPRPDAPATPGSQALAIFDDCFRFKDPAFRQLTHLNLILRFFAGGDPGEWMKLASLPHLTHFAFESSNTRALIYPALQACPRLECCILLRPVGADMDPAVWLPESGDVRFVTATAPDAQVDWQYGAVGSDDMWARADAVIAERRAAIAAERLAKEARHAQDA
ncbi:hypothetical protein C8R47DRAFT_1154687 [Mycena vitilis]|nr:hypothetical protein C8R47DRAFT_1154687 [Mycena vitilis]